MQSTVDALGPVQHLVPPNTLHHLFLTEWVAAYPKAVLHAPPGLQIKRPDLAFDIDLVDAPHPDWGGEIDHLVIAGNRITTEVAFFHRPSGTVLVADLLQQIPEDRLSGWRALVARLDLMTGPEPSVPRKFRLAFTDRKAARAAITRMLQWPAEQVVMAHGTPVTYDAPAFLRRAFGWLIT
ncbi:DUF4336 domain-containing protein [Actibacterium sp. 188UL27-1]|uniref:DUF4336 domain-containing protein n=1 Tax=Actibacterium sp. 188UL27-1 TaxID=2786961 RepID=UPI001EF45F5B|nr:DUF4336 domain-containing protein [Actibacterium sp. 188UL27-1]